MSVLMLALVVVCYGTLTVVGLRLIVSSVAGLLVHDQVPSVRDGSADDPSLADIVAYALLTVVGLFLVAQGIAMPLFAFG